MRRRAVMILAAITMLGGVAVGLPADAAGQKLEFHLVPSSPQIAACFPDLSAKVTVRLTADERGFDKLRLDARGLPAGQELTVFLLEQPGSPFGAAQYSGDVAIGPDGRGHKEFRLIVEEAFASTLVNGQRVFAELNHVGFWLADPTGDDACFPGGGPVTPFDGDKEASAQIMNSSNFLAGAPLP
jgi:hypothetical protein